MNARVFCCIIVCFVVFCSTLVATTSFPVRDIVCKNVLSCSLLSSDNRTFICFGNNYEHVREYTVSSPVRSFSATDATDLLVIFDDDDTLAIVDVTTGTTTPISVPNNRKPVKVASGYHHCMLLDDQSVWCNPLDEELSRLSNTAFEIITSSLPPDVSVVDISAPYAGEPAACVALNDSTVRCLGWNIAGAVGLMPYADNNYNILQDPIDLDETLPSGASYKLYSGWHTTCVVDTMNSVYLKCWGGSPINLLFDKFYGEDRRLKIDTVGGYRTTKICSGDGHICYLDENGDLFCMGDNDRGQAGTGNYSPVNDFAHVLSSVTDISCGWYHTCAVTMPGQVLKCFGDNQARQVSANSSVSPDSIPLPTQVQFSLIATGMPTAPPSIVSDVPMPSGSGSNAQNSITATGGIIGGVLAGVALVFVGVAFVLKRRRNNMQQIGIAKTLMRNSRSQNSDAIPKIVEQHLLMPTKKGARFIRDLCKEAIARLPRGKYAIFISYHQAGASADANYIYEYLVKSGVPSDLIFFDKEKLSNLDDLKDAVTRSCILLQLQSSNVYFRPYTLIEAYTAIHHYVPIVAVALEGYNFEDSFKFLNRSDFAVALDETNPGASEILVSSGIDPAEVGSLLGQKFPKIISLPYRAQDRQRVRDAQLGDIFMRALSQISEAGHTVTEI